MHSSSRFSPVHQLATWLNNEIATLYPGCFALVMATGIISNALFFEGYREWADTVFAVNLVAYPCLVLVWSKYWSEASISSIENLIALITVPVPHRRPG